MKSGMTSLPVLSIVTISIFTTNGSNGVRSIKDYAHKIKVDVVNWSVPKVFDPNFLVLYYDEFKTARNNKDRVKL